MTASAGDGQRPPGWSAALLTDAATQAARATGARVAAVYLRSPDPATLRLAVLSGLPGALFRPWWGLHVEQPFPVADAHRLRAPVVLANPAETMRRYPQFAAGLPFPFGSVSVPVVHASRAFGVLVVLCPPVADAAELVPRRQTLTSLADRLAEDLDRVAATGAEVTWDAAPLDVRPPGPGPAGGRVGCLTWDPVTDRLTADVQARALLGAPATLFPARLDALRAVAPELPALLREAAHGRPPPLPLPVRGADGALRLVLLWAPRSAQGRPSVDAVLLDPGSGALADGAADLLPQGVFCLDRLGVVGYANARAAQLLALERDLLLGRPLWEAVPWLDQPGLEDHLRAALLTQEPVHFQVRRPGSETREAYEGDWLALSVHPGAHILTCTVAPASRVPEPPWPPVGSGPAAEHTPDADADGAQPRVTAAAALRYRPIALAIALSEAVTARQVSAVVVQELLPAFGGRRLAIYLLQERHLYLAWETGFPEGFLTPFEGVALDARLPGVETLTTGRPLFFDSMEQLGAAYPGIPLDATEGARAFLPLIASGRPVGSCILGFDRSRSFSTEERTVLTALAGLIAHVMEKAQRYDTEAALAHGLQQALLPRGLPVHPRVETAGRYLPGTEGMDVGGDWYDVVPSGDGLALVIGDVQGHGVQAAATMGQLRSAVRAFALSDRPPEEVVSGTNRLLIDLDPGQFASCCYVRLDPVTGVARVVRAGHPPPLLREADGRARVVDLPGGVVLGVDPAARYPVAELRMAPGAVLALYTDGLVERPGFDIDDGIAALRLALTRAGAPGTDPGCRSLADVADRLTATARNADRPDDIALLLAALTGRDAGDV
ncbi:diguanylate cyclase [Streptomyces sp. Ru71]|uniref:SpoIIE family protein phosphatase n=1 Tax=Streptomyces sp. Ru71 TaxID=2080746 RepID=UPI000CDD50D6|nr:SpoIIE family protein phosphatase [Streptomyces sp. Ru71]POX46704.1 diguanylate cyclase [Streptomyces sp. Ru71]